MSMDAAIPERQPSRPVQIRRFSAGTWETRQDVVACEEPLEIRVEGRSVAVVMRTPGHDEELAAGFLVSEGAVVNWDSLTRHVFSASSCGLCGKTSLDSVFQQFPSVTADWQVDAAFIARLPNQLHSAQATFQSTGGLHACAIFDLEGNLIISREDVGRHNALDKVLGWALMQNRLPLDQHVLLLSGRVSFEMMQKALAAGIPLVAAISAPSSLAVEFADRSGQTLAGFVRGDTLNLYAHPHRVR